LYQLNAQLLDALQLIVSEPGSDPPEMVLHEEQYFAPTVPGGIRHQKGIVE
jgi:hypothetical protein